MSENTQLELFKAGLPDYIRAAAADDKMTKALAGGVGGKRLSIRGGIFRMVVDGAEVASTESRSINVVVVNAAPKVSRSFYEGEYEAGSAEQPDCSSADGERPDAGVPSPQAELCAKCPQNIAGSGKGDSRACRFHQRLALVLENDMGGSIYQLNLPAKSIFGKAEDGNMPLQAYCRFLGSHGAVINAMVTKLKFDKTADTPKLFFSPVRVLNQKEFETVKARGQEPDALNAINATPAMLDSAATKVAIEKPKEPVVEKAKVEVVDDDPEVVEFKPVKPAKPAKKAVAPAVTPVAESGEKSKLASILDAWKDEKEDE
jgi:hypothetical protein